MNDAIVETVRTCLELADKRIVLESQVGESGERGERRQCADERVAIELENREQTELLNSGRDSAGESTAADGEAAKMGEAANDGGELAAKGVARSNELAERSENGQSGEKVEERLRHAVVVNVEGGEGAGRQNGERETARDLVGGDLKGAKTRALREEIRGNAAGELIGAENDRREIGQRERGNRPAERIVGESERSKRRKGVESDWNCAADRIVRQIKQDEPRQATDIRRQSDLSEANPRISIVERSDGSSIARIRCTVGARRVGLVNDAVCAR